MAKRTRTVSRTSTSPSLRALSVDVGATVAVLITRDGEQDSATPLSSIETIETARVTKSVVTESAPTTETVSAMENADRVMMTSGRGIHGMSVNNGKMGAVRGVTWSDETTQGTLVAQFEKIDPNGLQHVAVTRTIYDKEMAWDCVGHTARLERIGDA